MAGETILVVDDEPGITRLCERLLSQAHYKVLSFTNPALALEHLVANRIDLLLVDIRMPEISGFDLIHQVRQSQPDAAILVMTGFGTVETAIQALRQGVDGLLLKPFERGAELVDAVDQALADNQKKRDIARIQALRPIFDITESFQVENRPEHLVELVLSTVLDHLRCENAAYFQVSREGSGYLLAGNRGTTFSEGGKTGFKTIVNRIDQQKEPIWLNANYPNQNDLHQELVDQQICSLMGASISKLSVRGVLLVTRTNHETPFRQVEWEMFLLLARQAAVAMENAQLYEELRDYVRRVEESQQALIRAEKMASAGRLTASIAHEINNPLQSVQNCLHLASRTELTGKKREEYLELANLELDRLMNTVQRMLDFYRPGAVEPQEVDVVSLWRHVISLLDAQLKTRGIRVTTGFSSKIGSILAVTNQLEQVFINLLLNSYDAMPEGGEIRVTARMVRDVIEIMVRDTGPGIPAEMQGRIFEPFVSTKKSGTGLGLAVSYGIIAAHGGSLDLVEEKGWGACFRVILPIKESL